MKCYWHQEEHDEKRLKITAKWGAIAGCGLIALELLKLVARNVTYPFGPIADILLILIFIAALVLAGKEYREKELDGVISFPKAFGAGCETVLVAFLLYFGYLFLHFNVIEKGGIDRINATYQANYLSRLQKDTLTEEELNTYLADACAILQKEKDALTAQQSADTACNALINGKVDSLTLFFSLRLKSQFGRDTSHYAYANFDEFAQKTMMDITQQALNVAPDEEQVCLSVFSRIALNAANSLTEISPLQKKFAAMQPDIPHYDNLLAVVLQSSFMVLLYGLFFNIFTALYIFKSKEAKRNCIASKENNEEPNPEEKQE